MRPVGRPPAPTEITLPPTDKNAQQFVDSMTGGETSLPIATGVNMTAEDIIRLLRLQPHPEEGGFFAETYRSGEDIAAGDLPARYGAPRSFSTLST